MASGRSIPGQLVLQDHIQRLVKIKRKQPLHHIALVASSVCGKLVDRTDDELSEFKANVANIASWIIFFDEKPSCLDDNVANKIRKAGRLCDRLATGERIINGETARKTFSLRRKAVDLDWVNDVVVCRLDQFKQWWGKEYEAWKEEVQPQGAEGGTPSARDSPIEPPPKLENIIDHGACRPRNPAPATEFQQSSGGPRLVSNNSFSEDKLATGTFDSPGTFDSDNQEEDDPTTAHALIPFDNLSDAVSYPEPAPSEDNISDFLDTGDDPENTEYDILISHEPEDEEEAKSIRCRLQRELKDKRGNTTAKVCIPGDFHYKGIRPNPLLAAVEKSTSVAFFISKFTGDMGRKKSILNSLDFLMTTAKEQHIEMIFVVVKGNKEQAKELLKEDNRYLKITAADGKVYDVNAPDFSKKMSQIFREHQHLTLDRRLKPPQPHSSRSETGRPITSDSSSTSEKQTHEGPPLTYDESAEKAEPKKLPAMSNLM
ncbi:uncharacterized protein LOC135492730 isoform X2 [Lineus longissimus]